MTNHNHSFLDIREMDADDIKNEKASAELNNLVGITLSQVYPGYPWGVHCDARTHTVRFWADIGNTLGRPPFGYVFTIKRDTGIPAIVARVKRGAGELLERYGLVRGAMNINEIGTLLEGADRLGRVKVDKG